MSVPFLARTLRLLLAVLCLAGLAAARAQTGFAPASTGTVSQSSETTLPLAPVEQATARVALATQGAQDDAALLGQLVRANMTSGGRYTVSITMQNTGSTTWSAAQGDALGSQNPANNSTWGVARVAPGVNVAPGQSYTFSFQVTAPVPGVYDMRWQMLQERVRWFGAITSSPVIVAPAGGPAETVTYIHTDGLGSPVARTDADGRLISRTRYEPYGATAAGAEPTIGFAGHVNDVDTGLVYMQQRYYDPVAGRFLSIDPVVTDANTGGSFNRYAYANNSPYKYIDPDGRNWALAGRGAVLGAEGGFAVCGPWCSAAGAVIVGGVTLWAGEKAINWIASESGGGNGNTDSDQSAGGGSKGNGSVGISSSLPKPPAGPGSVPKSERDPKRHFTPGEREAKRQEQGNKCGNGCGKDIDQSNSDGHHEVRHADGGRTTPDNHVEVCKECHKELHSGE